MKLDNISFSSPKIICVSRDITWGCPYDIHGIAQILFSVVLIYKFYSFENYCLICFYYKLLNYYAFKLEKFLTNKFKLVGVVDNVWETYI